MKNQLETYEKLCEDLGEAPANVALAWMLKMKQLLLQ